MRPPPLSPSPRLFSFPLPGSLFGKNCTQLEALECTQKDYGTWTYDELHRLRPLRGFARKDS